MKKTGTNGSKNGTKAFFQKTETESWGLPLMNGGLKTESILGGYLIVIVGLFSIFRKLCYLFKTLLRSIKEKSGQVSIFALRTWTYA